jgi:hypothetical protein
VSEKIWEACHAAWKEVLAESDGLSHSEIDQACRDAVKETILNDGQTVTESRLGEMLKERQSAHSERKG